MQISQPQWSCWPPCSSVLDSIPSAETGQNSQRWFHARLKPRPWGLARASGRAVEEFCVWTDLVVEDVVHSTRGLRCVRLWKALLWNDAIFLCSRISTRRDFRSSISLPFSEIVLNMRTVLVEIAKAVLSFNYVHDNFPWHTETSNNTGPVLPGNYEG